MLGKYAQSPLKKNNLNREKLWGARDMIHIIKWGDTLWKIAKKYGVTVSQLLEANPGIDPNNLIVGRNLNIPPKSPSMTLYKVKAGDTMYLIAQKYQVTVQQLATANSLQEPYLLTIGQWLKVPQQPISQPPTTTIPPLTKIYIVQPGDTLSSIAKKHNTSLPVLIALNKLPNPNLIYPGQQILVPQTVIIPTTPVPTTPIPTTPAPTTPAPTTPAPTTPAPTTPAPTTPVPTTPIPTTTVPPTTIVPTCPIPPTCPMPPTTILPTCPQPTTTIKPTSTKPPTTILPTCYKPPIVPRCPDFWPDMDTINPVLPNLTLPLLVAYQVKAGDTLLDLANSYQTTIENICAINCLVHQTIVEGQTIYIPQMSDLD